MRVFWLEPTDLERVFLRRYRSNLVVADDGAAIERTECPLPWKYHDRSILFIDQRPRVGHAISDPDHLAEDGHDVPSKEDPRWPPACNCGYVFQPSDEWQVFPKALFRAPDGTLTTLGEAPPGAMWDASWLPRHRPWTGPDGIALVVKTPDGFDWHVDGKASNCDKQGDAEHFCWCRHGDPRTGNVHVDKIGNTCGAGAGSIQTPRWHGFLHHGDLHT